MSSSPDLINIATNKWFDAFQDNGGPILYTSINRTAAIEDIRNILIYISFTTFFVAFLIIFPGIRKERISTFICVTTSLFIGAVILISNCGSNWHVAKGSIVSPYRAFSREKIYANVGVYIGLDSVNITLKALPIHQQHEEINYNERFYWIGANQMKQEFQRALAKGLPFPILTISEYLSQDGEGFNWGRHYRLAGYYTSISLWLAFASWILMNILLCAVPRYGAYTMQITGALMLLSNLLYVMMIPTKPLRIPFEGSTLIFSYGWCFWLILIAGLTAIFIGAIVSIVDILFPNKFSTILEVDYDTPYRYFVGNDIHLIGSLPPPLNNGYYSYHQHQPSLSGTSLSSHRHHHHQNIYQKKSKSNNLYNHYSASKTASLTTNTSSCCAGSTARLTTTSNHHHHHHQLVQQQQHHQSIIKTKSDASTCTRDDNDDLIMMIKSSSPSPSTTTKINDINQNDNDLKNQQKFITKVDIESINNNNNDNNKINELTNNNNNNNDINNNNNLNDKNIDNNNNKQFAFENRAYKLDDDDDNDDNYNEIINNNNNDNHNDNDNITNNNDDEKLLKNKIKSIKTITSPLIKTISSTSSQQSELSEEYSISSSHSSQSLTDDNESDVSTTIIDGKRAISLSNFGKFTEQREKREIINNEKVIHGPTFGHPLASAGFRAIKSGFITRQRKPMDTTTKIENKIKSSSMKQQSKENLNDDQIINQNNDNRTKSSTLSSSSSTIRIDLSSSAAMW